MNSRIFINKNTELYKLIIKIDRKPRFDRVGSFLYVVYRLLHRKHWIVYQAKCRHWCEIVSICVLCGAAAITLQMYYHIQAWSTSTRSIHSITACIGMRVNSYVLVWMSINEKRRITFQQHNRNIHLPHTISILELPWWLKVLSKRVWMWAYPYIHLTLVNINGKREWMILIQIHSMKFTHSLLLSNSQLWICLSAKQIERHRTKQLIVIETSFYESNKESKGILLMYLWVWTIFVCIFFFNRELHVFWIPFFCSFFVCTIQT